MPIVVSGSGGTSSIAPSSLTTLKARIASELQRSDLTTPIANAISSAITKYRSKRFEFAEAQDQFNTVANQETYTNGDTGFPTNIGQLDSVFLTIGQQRTTLEPVTFSELQLHSIATNVTGRPQEWAWYAQCLFLYPIPDTVYSLTLSHQRRYSPPTSDGDTSSVWTNEAEPLIRACAKKLICRDVIFDEEGFRRNEIAEEEALSFLMGESVQLQDDGSPMQSNF